MESAGKRILATGASGRLGSNLARWLTEHDVAARSFVLPDDPAERTLEGLDTETVYGDLRDEAAVERAVDGVDALVHCAAVTGAPAARERLGYAPEYPPERVIDNALAFRQGNDIGVIPT